MGEMKGVMIELVGGLAGPGVSADCEAYRRLIWYGVAVRVTTDKCAD